MRRFRACLIIAVAALGIAATSCIDLVSSEEDYVQFPGSDAALPDIGGEGEGGPGSDATIPDANIALPDGPVDAPLLDVPLPPDAPADSGGEGGVDAPGDAPADSGGEGGVDAPADSGGEGGVDAPVDSGGEGGIDAPVDAGTTDGGPIDAPPGMTDAGVDDAHPADGHGTDPMPPNGKLVKTSFYACSTNDGLAGLPIALALLALRRRRRC